MGIREKADRNAYSKSGFDGVIDSSGAHIPGHGTPTVIIFGRDRGADALERCGAVMGIRGEPSTPDDPSQGKVWMEIVARIDEPWFHWRVVSVTDVARETLHRHPWSLGGGGAAELKEALDRNAGSLLRILVAGH